MSRTFRVVLAAVLSLAGLAGVVIFLARQGLDRAEKWTSLVGMFVSVAVAVAGLVLGWLTWRQTSRPAAGSRSGRVSRTGTAMATGGGSTAVTGSLGSASGTAVDRTGDATAKDGGRAVSGEDRTGSTQP
ncbi:hypothetical protein [Micromonospora chalcea]|uniref:hypothetical protein n=1 Tax=Micromonospora chalcea TaxID=1874 RepID=UPI003D747928